MINNKRPFIVLIALTCWCCSPCEQHQPDKNAAPPATATTKGVSSVDSLWASEEFAKARALDRRALAAYQRVKYDSAIHLWETASSIMSDLHKLSGSIDHLVQEVEFQSRAGVVYRKKGYAARAIKVHTTCVDKVTAARVDDQSLLAKLFNNLAMDYRKEGDYDSALQFSHKSLNLRTEQYGYHSKKVAQNYTTLALIHDDLGEVENALHNHLLSLSIKEKLGLNKSTGTAITLNNIGLCYQQLSEYDLALKYFRRALTVYEQSPANTVGSQADTQKNIANTLLLLQQHSSARKTSDKALSLARLAWNENHETIADIQLLIAEIQIANSELHDATKHLQKGLSALYINWSDTLRFTNPPDSLESLSELVLLELLLAKGKCFEKVAAETADVFEPESAWLMAYGAYREAAYLTDRLRRSYKAEGSKLIISARSREVYDNAIRLALFLAHKHDDTSYKHDVFEYAQLSRNAVLHNQISESKARTLAGLPDSLYQLDQRLRSEVAFYETQLALEQSKSSETDGKQVESLRNDLFQAKLRHSQFAGKLEVDYPKYHRHKYRYDYPTVQQVQANLDDSTTIVQYVSSEDFIYCLTLDCDAFNVTTIPRHDSLEQFVAGMRENVSINPDHSTSTRDLSKIVYYGEALYGQLLAPILEHANTEKLHIISDYPFNTLPFEVLVIPSEQRIQGNQHDPNYLIKQKQIRYGYLIDLEMEPQSQPGDVSADVELLAFAPVFAPTNTKSPSVERFLTSTSSGQRNGGHIPFSLVEVENIEDMFGQKLTLWQKLMRLFQGTQNRIYYHRAATEAQLKQAESGHNHRFIHISTHGKVDFESPMLSGLAFLDDSCSTDDGILHLREIYALDLEAELVVLSACETALGKQFDGEGLIGLARGFMFAGAKETIVSLWQVNDGSTAQLMKIFYEYRLNGVSSDKALRLTKLRFLSDRESSNIPPDYAHPYHWAPFVLMGR